MKESSLAAVSLVELPLGQWARLVRVGEGDFGRRLQEMGLTPGAECRLVRVAPLGDPFEIEFRGARLCARREELAGFEAEPIARG